MDRRSLTYIQQILDEIEVLNSVPKLYTFVELQKSPLSYRGKIYAIQIISEASRKLPPEWLEDFPDIPWREIRAVGNITRHEYAHLRPAMIWEIINVHIPNLSATIIAMQNKHTHPLRP
jgi:uncharacterized protein with HEPN domain